MPKSSVLCYMNWAVEYGEADAAMVANFATTAPLSNMLTERPGQKAVWIGAGQPTLRFRFVDPVTPSTGVGRPVGVVAIVNCNLISLNGAGDSIELTLTDTMGLTARFTPGATDIGLRNDTQNNIVFMTNEESATSWDVGFDVNNVVELYFNSQGETMTFGRLDAWTNTVTVEDPYFGTLVAGPVWRPVYGIRLVGYAPGTIDRSIIVRSIGGSLWAAQSQRQRRLTAEMALVSETEVEAQPPLCGLRQMSEHCGISRPVLVIPSDVAASRIHSQAVYGCFDDPLTWAAVDKSETPDVGLEPHYKSGFTILESR